MGVWACGCVCVIYILYIIELGKIEKNRKKFKIGIDKRFCWCYNSVVNLIERSKRKREKQTKAKNKKQKIKIKRRKEKWLLKKEFVLIVDV